MKILFALLMLLIPVSSYANHQVGHDGVIAINKWDLGNSGPYPLWNFHNGNVYDVFEDCGASPSGGGAVRGNFAPGPYTSSVAGGSSSYDVPASTNITTLYFGVWICYSSPFQFHPVSSKIIFMTQRNPSGGNIGPLGKDNLVVNVNGQGNGGMVATAQLWWDNCTSPPNHATQICTRPYAENRGHVNIIPGRWHWLELQATMNSVGNGFSSSRDGIIRVWVDDTLTIEYTNAVLMTSANNVWHNLANTPILGGGGSWSINQYQYQYYDWNVISTKRIGRPGGPPVGGDTTAPSTPVITGITTTSTTATVSFTGSTDAGGMWRYRALRCTNHLCTTHAQVGSVNHTSGASAGSYTFTDTGLAPSTVYSYRILAEDLAVNPSALSVAVEATTAASSSLPNITAWTTSATGGTVAWSSSPATANVRFRYGGTLANGQPWSDSFSLPIAQLPGGVLSFIWPQNTAWGCAEAGNAVPTYNTDPAAYFCRGVTPQQSAASGTLRALTSNPMWLTLDGTNALYRVGISGGSNCNSSFCGLQDVMRSDFTGLIPSTVVTHTFDGTTTDLGQTWDAGYGAYPRLDINSGVVRPSAIGDDNAETYSPTIHGDQSAEIDVVTFNDPGFGKIGVKVNYAAPGTDSGYQCHARRNGALGHTSRIVSLAAGTPTTLQFESATTWVTGNKLRCRRIGDKVYLDRSTNAGVSWTTLLTATTTTYRNGRVGTVLAATTAVTNVTADNFKAGPIVADYATQMNTLVSDGGNWLRFWILEQSTWGSDAAFAANTNIRIPLNQFPYNQVSTRVDTSTGTNVTVGVYDLNDLYQPFFDRIQARVDAALALGVTPIITLFSGGHLSLYGLPPTFNSGFSHPFYSGNNVNGISCDTNANEACEEAHSLSNANITAVQRAYIARLIQTIGNRPVIIEVSNEDGSDTSLWQNAMMEQVRTSEATYATSAHVILQSGFNFNEYASNTHLFTNARNNAVAPLCTSDGVNWDTNPPANDGTKLIFYDSDHTGYNAICGTWTAIVPWKLFTRAIYPIYLDERESAPVRTAIKAAMAQAKYYGSKINLATAYPETGTSIFSTGYGLSTYPTIAGCSEYLMLMPADGSSTINLTGCSGGNTFDVETLNLTSGVIASAGTTTGGAIRSFNPAGSDPMVIYLKSTGVAADTTAPILSAGSPAGVLEAGTTETPMRVTSDEACEARYDDTAGVAHASKATAFTTTDVLNHEVTVGSLTDGTPHVKYVTCQDPSGNVSAEMTIAFSVAAAVDTTLPTDASAVTGISTNADTAILWQFVAGEDANLTHHIIEIYNVNEVTGELTTLVTTANITAPGTSYLQQGLVAGNTYRAQVKAADALNVSLNWSASAMVHVDVPETMTGLVAAPLFTHSAIVNVTAAAQQGVQGSYELCTGALCNSGWVSAGIPAGLSVTFSGLTPATTYGVRGKWVNVWLGGISAEWSSTLYFTTLTSGGTGGVRPSTGVGIRRAPLVTPRTPLARDRIPR